MNAVKYRMFEVIEQNKYSQLNQKVNKRVTYGHTKTHGAGGGGDRSKEIDSEVENLIRSALFTLPGSDDKVV